MPGSTSSDGSHGSGTRGAIDDAEFKTQKRAILAEGEAAAADARARRRPTARAWLTDVAGAART